MTDLNQLSTLLKKLLPAAPYEKSARYVGKFYACEVRDRLLKGLVVGNHGEYRVSYQVTESGYANKACSCYIGKHGCHHTDALAYTFLQDPARFRVIEKLERSSMKRLEAVAAYLEGVTLEELLDEMRSYGIVQSEFADVIGMASGHLAAVKASERRNRFFHELGATKLACLWVMERFGKRHAQERERQKVQEAALREKEKAKAAAKKLADKAATQKAREKAKAAQETARQKEREARKKAREQAKLARTAAKIKTKK